MKKITLLFASALVSVVALASEPAESSKRTGLAVVKKGEAVFQVFYQPESLSAVKISITDEAGKVLFTESYRKSDGFVRPFNFSEMSEGKYYLTVEDNAGKKEQVINYTKERLAKKSHVHKVAANKYMVSFLGLNEKVTVKVKEGSKLIHSEDILVAGDSAKIFRIENLVGDATFEVFNSKGVQIN